MNLTGPLAPFYNDEPFFTHLSEMFSGQNREIEPKPLSKVILPEFRPYSTDPQISQTLRDLDIIGLEVVFPRDHQRLANVMECEGETYYELGKYDILRPKERVERQVLRVMIAFVQDFTDEATKFIEGVAKTIGLNDSERKRKSKGSTTDK